MADIIQFEGQGAFRRVGKRVKTRARNTRRRRRKASRIGRKVIRQETTFVVDVPRIR